MERIHALLARRSIINKLGRKCRIICHTVTHINLMFHCSTEKDRMTLTTMNAYTSQIEMLFRFHSKYKSDRDSFTNKHALKEKIFYQCTNRSTVLRRLSINPVYFPEK